MGNENQSLHSLPFRTTGGDEPIPVIIEGGEVVRFVMWDDIDTFHAIPKTMIRTTVVIENWFEGELISTIPVPNARVALTAWVQSMEIARELSAFYFQVSINNVMSDLPVERPEGKKAYLHGVSYAAYDGHEANPAVTQFANTEARVEHFPDELPGTNEILTDGFGTSTDIFGILLGWGSPDPNTTIPEFVEVSYANNLHTSSTGDRTATFDGFMLPTIPSELIAYRDDRIMSEAEWYFPPRSNTRGGKLPTDWIINNFELTLLGYDDDDNFVSVLWDSKGRTSEDGVTMKATSETRGDEMMPAIYNEINNEIPDEVTQIKVKGIRPHWITMIAPSGIDIRTSDPSSRTTVVRMPLKINLSILYAE